MRQILGTAVDFILPPRCVVSGEIVEEQGMLASQAWASLNFISRPYCDCCGLPFELDMGDAELCASCLSSPPYFDKARAALRYDTASRNLILGFKHGDQIHAVKAFSPWLLRAGESFLSGADYLVPVPLHRWRFLKRRYNQAALIADALSKAASVPVLYDALLRNRATPVQGHLKRDERKKNVARAFTLGPDFDRLDLKDRIIVLIDDVFTTGATTNECARVLKKGGAKEVYILTLARVVRGDF